MVRVTALIPLLSLLAPFTFAASAVLDLIPSNFDKVVLESGKPALVEFFAPWCGHCKNLAPTYEELASKFAFASEKVVIGKVDADEHKSLGKKYGVQGFPTLKWFDGKSKTPEDYEGGRDLESLVAWITKKTGLKPKTVPSSVVHLDDRNFNHQIGGDKNVIVAFTAPWCGHCKKLVPVWETLATTFSRDDNVVIAKLDCEAPTAKATAEEQGVNSYPTIKFFPKGSKDPITYDGDRAESDFVEFLNEKAGTFRLPGGGLNSLAGTVENLDKILKEGSDTVYDQVMKASKGIQEKYATYYEKVARKVSQNKEYVEKELKRLQGMLKKGGLAPEKVDDLISRSNILKKFMGEETVSGKDEL